jgi:hypothetical protein
LLFAYYSFFKAPAFFNQAQERQVLASTYATEYSKETAAFTQLQSRKKELATALSSALQKEDEPAIDNLRLQLQGVEAEGKNIRKNIQQLIKKVNPGADTNDTNYIFLRFVGDVLPVGLVGLIIAIIFLAAWGSIAAALNSLASCTMIDFHKKFTRQTLTAEQEYRWGKMYTLLWGVFCIVIAQFAYNLGNSLIEAVNILGSWFYGTILGIFLVAFYMKFVKGNAVFVAAVLSELVVIAVYYLDIISFLWLNVIGAVCVLLFSFFIQILTPVRRPLTKE